MLTKPQDFEAINFQDFQVREAQVQAAAAVVVPIMDMVFHHNHLHNHHPYRVVRAMVPEYINQKFN